MNQHLNNRSSEKEKEKLEKERENRGDEIINELIQENFLEYLVLQNNGWNRFWSRHVFISFRTLGTKRRFCKGKTKNKDGFRTFSLQHQKQKECGEMPSKFWRKFYTQPNSHTGIRKESRYFPYKQSQNIYYPCTLFQKATAGYGPLKQQCQGGGKGLHPGEGRRLIPQWQVFLVCVIIHPDGRGLNLERAPLLLNDLFTWGWKVQVSLNTMYGCSSHTLLQSCPWVSRGHSLHSTQCLRAWEGHGGYSAARYLVPAPMRDQQHPDHVW